MSLVKSLPSLVPSRRRFLFAIAFGPLLATNGCAEIASGDEGQQASNADEGAAPGDPPADVPDALRVISEIAFQPYNQNPCVRPDLPLKPPTRSQEMVFLGPFQGGRIVRGTGESFDAYSDELCRFVGTTREPIRSGGTATSPGMDVFVYEEWNPSAPPGAGRRREYELRRTGVTTALLNCGGQACATSLSESRLVGFRLARCGGGPCVEFCPPGMVDSDEGCKALPGPFVLQPVSGELPLDGLPEAPLANAAAPTLPPAAGARLTAGIEGECTLASIASGALGAASAAVVVTGVCAAAAAPTVVGEVVCAAPAATATVAGVAALFSSGLAYLVCDGGAQLVQLVDAPPEVPQDQERPQGYTVDFRSPGGLAQTHLCEYDHSLDEKGCFEKARVSLPWGRDVAVARDAVLAGCQGEELRYFCRKMQRLVQLSSDDATAKLRIFNAAENKPGRPNEASAPEQCRTVRDTSLGSAWRRALGNDAVETTEHVIDLQFGGADGALNYVGLSSACNTGGINTYFEKILKDYMTDRVTGQAFTNKPDVKCLGTKLKFESSNELRDMCFQNFNVVIP